ncbi:hypothetical protein Cfor_11411 [Coptotermes formosanus]|jgi:hypothetical protein|uniref:Uncharacterized protein n=1 Tax=Coptotermes formosanus TaxID=36987 RepID=A0A6L2PWF6_COPFO|nr:hypothetical protein Cfor_11411 [Coptotermes formosanus]
MKPAEIFGRMCAQCGGTCRNRLSFYACVEKFREGHVSFVDEPRSGRPIEFPTDALKERVEELILSDRRFNINEISDALNVSVGTVHRTVHDTLQFLKNVRAGFRKF